VRSTAAPYTESRLAHLVRNKCVGFPVVEQAVTNLLASLAVSPGFASEVGSSDFDIFFINPICFMCFWFGLEILRLVYKKAFFEILNGFYLT
jgi:hypothetical protein